MTVFFSCQEYIATFLPLIFEECRASLLSNWKGSRSHYSNQRPADDDSRETKLKDNCDVYARIIEYQSKSQNSQIGPGQLCLLKVEVLEGSTEKLDNHFKKRSNPRAQIEQDQGLVPGDLVLFESGARSEYFY